MNRLVALLLCFVITACACGHAQAADSQSQIRSNATNPASAQNTTLFPVQVGDLYGYMDKTGRLILAPKFGLAVPFHEGLAQVYVAPQGGKWTKQNGTETEFYVNRGFIDQSGKIRFMVNFPQNEDYNKHFLSPTTVGEFSEGRAVVELRAPDRTSKEGYIDANGKLVIPASFDRAGAFSEGLAAVELFNPDFTPRCGFIDPNGNFVIQSQFSDAKEFSDGMAAVQDTGTKLWGYINKSGEYVIAPRFRGAWSFSEGYAVAETAEGRTLIDKSGAPIGAMAPAIGKFSQGLAAVNVGGKGANWSSSLPSEAATGGTWGFQDSAGRFVIEPQFESAHAFSEGLAAVNVGGTVKDGVVEGGKWGYIDKAGNRVILAQFDEAFEFKQGLANVETSSGLYGLKTRSFYIDPSGNEVKPTKSGTRGPSADARTEVPAVIEPRDPERIARESNELGKKAASVGDNKGALQQYTEAVQADPHYYKAYYNRAQIYVDQQNYKAASEDFSRALTEEPELYDAYNNRANCYMYLHEFHEAVADYTQVIKYQRAFEQAAVQQAYVNRAWAYLALGMDKEAWQDVTAATNQGAEVPAALTAKLRERESQKSGKIADIVTVDDELGKMRPTDLQSAHKVSGLFVGISNYPVQSGVQPTPAHTIGAALFHEIFYRAEANRLGIAIERSGLGKFTSEYHPASDEVLFKYKGMDYFEMSGASLGRMPQPDIPSLKLMADLRIDPRDPVISPSGVVRILAGIDGSWLQLRDHANAPVALSPPGYMWPYFGRGNYISKSAILDALDKSLSQASKDVQEPLEFFVFYVAAHGGLDKDLSPFIITANEQLESPERLYYEDVLKVIDRIKVSSPGRRLLRIVVFDACQELDEGNPGKVREVRDLPIPPDTILVTSTSPGHYAWHLPTSISEHHEENAKDGGPLSREQKHVFDQGFSSTASVFPMASQASLKIAERNSQSISVNDWLAGIEPVLPQLLSSADIDSGFQVISWRPRESGGESPILFKKMVGDVEVKP